MRDPVLIGAEDARSAAASLARSVPDLRQQVGYLEEVCARRIGQFEEANNILEKHIENLRAVIDDNPQTELESLRKFVRDLRDHGLSFDLTPTHDVRYLLTPEGRVAGEFWHDYIKRMDERIRLRARGALGG